jgi:4-alpha-glucanotransferase
MQELGLVGLRIQRMPNESDLEFGIPSQYSYMTVNFPYTIAYPYFTLVCL